MESSGPTAGPPSLKERRPGGEDEETVSTSKEPEKQPPLKRPESRPSQISPGAPPSQPMILRQRPGPAPAVSDQESPAQPAEKQPAIAPRGERLESGEPPAAPLKRPVGPVAATVPGGKGSFYVNVYQLPDSVKALPDYSALRPVESLTTDKINLDPARGQSEPADSRRTLTVSV